MTKARWFAILLVLLTLAGVAVPAALACMDGEDLVLVDGELPGGG
jgi:hypothetical protein